MKKGVFILLFCILFSSIACASTWPFSSETVTIDVEVNSGLIIKPTGENPYVESLTANLSFVPLETDTQSIVSIKAEPKPTITGEIYQFRWEEPSGEISFRINSQVKTKNTKPKVKKTPFPLYDVEGFEEYTKPSANIDSDNPVIVKKASELAEGETELYGVVFNMAEWTRTSIQYNLSTLTAKASQKASWVMQNRRGVCDEITTLFIAMLRSVGVPAKFVSGVAYTESPLFPQDWGGHGWAEVYFPGSGWIPFDVTYAQYGWVDPTHVKMQEEIDSGASSIKYSWLGRDVEMQTEQINVAADVVEHKGQVDDYVALRMDVVQPIVGIGSWNLVEVSVKNLADGHVSAFIYLASIKELEMPGGNVKAIWLPPKREKKLYWLVKVDETLDRGYEYTFPMTSADIFNTTATKTFNVNPEATVFSRNEMQRVKEAYEEGEEKVYSKEIEIKCNGVKGYYYNYDKPAVTCKVTNRGNFNFKKLRFCFDECTEASLGIMREKIFTKELDKWRIGVNKVEFRVEGEDVSKTKFFDLKILDEPTISVVNNTYPKEIEFQKKYTYEFMLSKDSASDPQNVTLEFSAGGMKKTLEVGEMKGDKKYLFNLDSKDLGLKPNPVVVSVVYNDKNGKTYTLRDEKIIDLVNVTFGQKMVIFLKSLDRGIRNLFD